MGQHDPLIADHAPSARDRTWPAAVGRSPAALAAADFWRYRRGRGDRVWARRLLTARVAAHRASAQRRPIAVALPASVAGLDVYARHGEWRQPVAHRLAFRELGLAIGLDAAGWLQTRPELAASAPVRRLLDALVRYASVGEEIVRCWREPVHHATPGWSQHEDINEVMLATTLAPEGFVLFASGTDAIP
jgi:hypothetical protein